MATALDSSASGLEDVEDQTAFNLAAWAKVIADPELAKYPFRIETDRYGNPVMLPPPDYGHAKKQSRIGSLLDRLLHHGFTASECPIATSAGVKAVDAAWISQERDAAQADQLCLTRAPEICVEVLSPSNTRREMAEKRALYFEAGAEEVWFCHRDGRMEFFLKDPPETLAPTSRLCPAFPARLDPEP